MLTIRKAESNEYNAVRNFYYDLIDHLELLDYRPGWQKGVYPADDYIQKSIENDELFIGMKEDGVITSAMIINESGNESYKNGKWSMELNEGDYVVIHALGVTPAETKKGYAKEMVHAAIDYAKENSYAAIRLDVLCGNLSASRLYESVGFLHADTIQMFYEDTGWVDFALYEYKIENEKQSF